MKKIALALMVAGICATPSMASAESNPYVSISAGLAPMHSQDIKIGSVTYDSAIDYKSGLAIEGAVGTKIDNYRAELAIGYQSNDMDNIVGITISDVEISLLSYMANGYMDFKMDGEVSPYLMGGVGFTTITGKSGSASTDDTVIAYQVGAGVSMEASENVAIDLGYRYFATGEADGLIDEWTASFASSKILLGMRYSF